MPDRVPTCPHCGAPVTASRFARIAVCDYCKASVHLDDGVLSAARFREAYQAWREAPAPKGDDGARRFTVNGDVWRVRARLGRGEIADVYEVDRLNGPLTHAVLHRRRDAIDAPFFDQAWRALTALAERNPPSSSAAAARLPRPIARDAQHLLFRFAPGFHHTFEDVRAAYPQGVPPVSAMWMWRRILESLGLIHDAGLAHGAVLPQHLIVENGEHGLRMVGFGCAAAEGQPLLAICTAHRALYPPELLHTHVLSRRNDLQMSAASMAYALGADVNGALPAAVPAPLAELISAVRAGSDRRGAWALREWLGPLSERLFGPAGFHPLNLNQRGD